MGLFAPQACPRFLDEGRYESNEAPGCVGYGEGCVKVVPEIGWRRTASRDHVCLGGSSRIKLLGACVEEYLSLLLYADVRGNRVGEHIRRPAQFRPSSALQGSSEIE